MQSVWFVLRNKKASLNQLGPLTGWLVEATWVLSHCLSWTYYVHLSVHSYGCNVRVHYCFHSGRAACNCFDSEKTVTVSYTTQKNSRASVILDMVLKIKWRLTKMRFFFLFFFWKLRNKKINALFKTTCFWEGSRWPFIQCATPGHKQNAKITWEGQLFKSV